MWRINMCLYTRLIPIKKEPVTFIWRCFLSATFFSFYMYLMCVCVLVSFAYSLIGFFSFLFFLLCCLLHSILRPFVRFLLLFHYIVNNFLCALISFVQFHIVCCMRITLIVYSNVFELQKNNLTVFTVCLISCMKLEEKISFILSASF